MSQSKPLQPLSMPLSGTRLIEASAGTGKTYNIANIYLRLVLGMGDHSLEAPLTVDRILVVTFTRAAAAELKSRIRALLEKAYSDFREGNSEHGFIQSLIDRVSEEEQEQEHYIRLLGAALLQMDEASISTIHSFAVAAAANFVFETGFVEGSEIAQSGDDATVKTLTDLYREITCDTDPEAQQLLAMMEIRSHKEFVQRYRQELPDEITVLGGNEANKDWASLKLAPQALDQRHNHAIREWQALANSLDGRGTRDARIKAAYNDQVFDDQWKMKTTALVKNISNYMSQAKPGYQKPGGPAAPFNQWLNVPHDAGSGPVFDLLMKVREIHLDFERLKARDIEICLTRMARQRLSEAIGDPLSLDDVIKVINRRLSEPATEHALRSAIIERYPVCLVDEFQDTDPAQFEMFNRLYGKQEKAGFFMVGDPKQSIYAFRGADIFAYLNVRQQILDRGTEDPSIFSLNENFRSKTALVNATNELFREPTDGGGGQKTFLFDGIDYQTVLSAEQERSEIDKGRLVYGNDATEHPSLVFVGQDNEATDNKNRTIQRFAHDTAARISMLLSGAQASRIEHDGEDRPLQPGDIAVLVRTGTEANAVREALAQPAIGLRCVYLSQKDSVFRESDIAQDLYHVLRAMNQPADKRMLKTALATPLLRGFTFDFTELNALENDDQTLESLISEFTTCHQHWVKTGVLHALNHLLGNPQRNLNTHLAQRPDSDRLATDLRHLGDVLQQQDLQCDSQEQLIDWYARQLDDDSAVDEDSKRIRLESDENLIKILTIHVAKGLEFPVVFLPFFYFPWSADLKKNLPYYRSDTGDGHRAVLDFENSPEEVKKHMNREILAEDMRLLYVAITRAIYLCHVGISESIKSNKKQFGHTVWPHLLNLEAPENNKENEANNTGTSKTDDDHLDTTWAGIQRGLKNRLKAENPAVTYSLVGDATPVRYQTLQPDAPSPGTTLQQPRSVAAPFSRWEITSYSSLARGKTVSITGKDDDDTAASEQATDYDPFTGQNDDPAWQDDIRQSLQGGAHTGDALHDILEKHALEPEREFTALVDEQLQRRGLGKPFRRTAMSDADYQRLCDDYIPAVVQWLQLSMKQPLRLTDRVDCPTLASLFADGGMLPEMTFDFRIGAAQSNARFSLINKALEQAGVRAMARDGEISGLMTGAIDLTFVHDNRIYVVDYKSNTLGAAPRFYDETTMSAKIVDSRYDLQYLIYTVAANRYLGHRLGERYNYDGENTSGDSPYSFGGVFYLFLRGMGLQNQADGRYKEHGIWFTRPDIDVVRALDQAFSGKAA